MCHGIWHRYIVFFCRNVMSRVIPSLSLSIQTPTPQTHASCCLFISYIYSMYFNVSSHAKVASNWGSRWYIFCIMCISHGIPVSHGISQVEAISGTRMTPGLHQRSIENWKALRRTAGATLKAGLLTHQT